MSKAGFFDVPTVRFRTSVSLVDVPMFFYDVGVRQLNFFVDYRAAQSKLEGTGLNACRFFNGRAMATMIFFNYRDVAIGAYDEVTIVILCYPEAFEDPKLYLPNLLKRNGRKWTVGGYVLEMPVTMPRARAAGREIWGYPKFETEIPFRLSGSRFEYVVLDPVSGDPIVEVSGTMGPGIGLPAYDLVTYGNHDGSILHTITQTEGRVSNCMLKDLSVKVGETDHRMAGSIRDLGLDRLKPFAASRADGLRTRLCRGWPVAEQPTPPMPYAVEGEGWALKVR